jgi:hypothetical protein
MAAESFGCEYNPATVEYLLERHYRPSKRPMRRCHPRDLLLQIRCACTYNDMPLTMTPQMLDRAVDSYFTVVG